MGILDSYFPDVHFFSEFERFDRHVDKLRRCNNPVDYISICSPNYLHDAHVRFALRSGSDAICEKPLVLNPWNIDGLYEIEQESEKKIYTILQLRLHPSVTMLKHEIASKLPRKKHEIDLTYITSRGNWYLQSWKGDSKKSGGIATNIGIHFFDMLYFVFGGVQENILHYSIETKAAGYLELAHARVRWFLSIDSDDIPAVHKAAGKRTFRSITCDGEEIEFSDGFTDLHTQSYEEILKGNGYGLESSRVAIETVSSLRHVRPRGLTGEYHPLLNEVSL
ncbi:UDP-N-acetyl-2-amino-2-deoxyglucuronate dehydrogenase [Desulfurispira natronophila]|uniref:UDP-N-acetyl-2-amino-2-deoxyglucuronate dehydrogenase n=1 Tax=Desulfurispira natronophila TaxID=682562 RepID=A0A7W8DGZ2_9BACT|nr:UDP-N-acetyl-2-amino-2-deoxyglucuronate dehydrogenase [Desulfurispira natronophila]